MEQCTMDRENMELVGVTHVLDAITFWAQNVNEYQAIEKMNNALADKCPTAQRLLGSPNPQKVKEALVELPEDLQAPCLAKKYKFWGFYVSSDQDSAHFQQGKAFLQNLIYGKKVRIQKKSVCFDGTILVQAFQGNLDIGEEMKFAKFTLPESNRESPMSVRALQESPCLWPQRVLDWAGPQGDGDMPGSPTTACFPRPEAPVNEKKDQELVEDNQRLTAERDAQQQNNQRREDQLRDSLSELQKLKEETANYAKEAERWKAERNTLQNQSEQLEKHLQDAKQEVQ
ncbi:unnamed protein product, partial [Coregonus sp. 'balchen']